MPSSLFTLLVHKMCAVSVWYTSPILQSCTLSTSSAPALYDLDYVSCNFQSKFNVQIDEHSAQSPMYVFVRLKVIRAGGERRANNQYPVGGSVAKKLLADKASGHPDSGDHESQRKNSAEAVRNGRIVARQQAGALSNQVGGVRLLLINVLSFCAYRNWGVHIASFWYKNHIVPVALRAKFVSKMPRSSAVDEIKSLESLCVQSVAKNLDKVKWYQSVVEDEGNKRYTSSSPFDALRKEFFVVMCWFMNFF